MTKFTDSRRLLSIAVKRNIFHRKSSKAVITQLREVKHASLFFFLLFPRRRLLASRIRNNCWETSALMRSIVLFLNCFYAIASEVGEKPDLKKKKKNESAVYLFQTKCVSIVTVKNKQLKENKMFNWSFWNKSNYVSNYEIVITLGKNRR